MDVYNIFPKMLYLLWSHILYYLIYSFVTVFCNDLYKSGVSISIKYINYHQLFMKFLTAEFCSFKYISINTIIHSVNHKSKNKSVLFSKTKFMNGIFCSNVGEYVILFLDNNSRLIFESGYFLKLRKQTVSKKCVISS